MTVVILCHVSSDVAATGETQTVEDYPPPEGFRLDHTPV